MFERLGELTQRVRRTWRNSRAWGLRTWRNPTKRERVKATATFAFIFAFAVGSMDYLITGGPDWNPDGGQAYASEYVAPVRLSFATAEAAPLEPPPTLAEIDAKSVDYSFTSEDLLGGPVTSAAFDGFDPFVNAFAGYDANFIDIAAQPLY